MGVNISTLLCLRKPSGDVSSLSRGPFIPRDYDLYGLMAGVRGEHRLFEPRGLPEGSDSHIRRELGQTNPDMDGYHSYSWLTVAELHAVADAYLNEPSFHYAATPHLNVGFAMTLGAMVALERWCEATGAGEAILVFSFG